VRSPDPKPLRSRVVLRPRPTPGSTDLIAARIQLVVSATTHRLVEGYSAAGDLAPKALKGTSLPVQAFEVIEETTPLTLLPEVAEGVADVKGKRATRDNAKRPPDRLYLLTS